MVTTEEIKRFVSKIEEKDDFEFSVHSRFASQDKQHLYGAKPNWRDISEIKYRGKVIYQR